MDFDLRLDLGLDTPLGSGLIPLNDILLTESGEPITTEDGNFIYLEGASGMPKISELTSITQLQDNDILVVARPNTETFQIDKNDLKPELSVFFKATLVDENDTIYMYYGGENNEAWQINRILRADGTKATATETNNPGTIDLTTAWSNRGTLSYS